MRYMILNFRVTRTSPLNIQVSLDEIFGFFHIQGNNLHLRGN